MKNETDFVEIHSSGSSQSEGSAHDSAYHFKSDQDVIIPCKSRLIEGETSDRGEKDETLPSPLMERSKTIRFSHPYTLFSLLLVGVCLEEINTEFFYTYNLDFAREGSLQSDLLYASVPLSLWISGYFLGMILDRFRGSKNVLKALICLQFAISGACQFLTGFGAPFGSVPLWIILRIVANLLSYNGIIIFFISSVLFPDAKNDNDGEKAPDTKIAAKSDRKAVRQTTSTIYYSARTVSPIIANLIIMSLPTGLQDNQKNRFEWPFRISGLLCLLCSILTFVYLLIREKKLAVFEDVLDDVKNEYQSSKLSSSKSSFLKPSSSKSSSSIIKKDDCKTQKIYYRHFRWYCWVALVFSKGFICYFFFMEQNRNVRQKFAMKANEFAIYRMAQTAISVGGGCLILYLLNKNNRKEKENHEKNEKNGSSLTNVRKLILAVFIATLPLLSHCFILLGIEKYPTNFALRYVLMGNGFFVFMGFFCFNSLTNILIIEWADKFPDSYRGKLQGFTISLGFLGSVVGASLKTLITPPNDRLDLKSISFLVMATFLVLEIAFLVWVDRRSLLTVKK